MILNQLFGQFGGSLLLLLLLLLLLDLVILRLIVKLANHELALLDVVFLLGGVHF